MLFQLKGIPFPFKPSDTSLSFADLRDIYINCSPLLHTPRCLHGRFFFLFCKLRLFFFVPPPLALGSLSPLKVARTTARYSMYSGRNIQPITLDNLFNQRSIHTVDVELVTHERANGHRRRMFPFLPLSLFFFFANVRATETLSKFVCLWKMLQPHKGIGSSLTKSQPRVFVVRGGGGWGGGGRRAETSCM